MAGVQPTQELPPWLSISSITTIDATGGPTTETTLVMLPLTYFGPSIPLGSNGVWTFGGSTFPASIAIPNTTPTSTPSLTTISTTTRTGSFSTTTSLVTQSSPTVSSSSLITSTPISSTSSALATTSVVSVSTSVSSYFPLPTGSTATRPRRLTANSIAAIVIVCAFIVILVSFVLYLCCRKGGRFYRSRYRIWSDIESKLSLAYLGRRRVRPEEQGYETQEVAREQEPLVQADSEAHIEPGAEVPPRLVSSREAPIGTALSDGRITPSSTFTSLLREELLGAIRPSPSLFFHGNDSESNELPLNPFSPPPRRSIPRFHVMAQEEPLLPPPSINPDQGRPTSQFTSNSNRSVLPSIAYPDSPVSDIDETAALMTASRVRVGSGDNSPQMGGLGMSLARLGRLSWFDRIPPDDDPVERRSASIDRCTNTSRRRREMAQRSNTSLAVAQGNRFSISATTASSGPTVYYDAHSRPRSQVSTGGLGSDQWGYTAPDILDMPVPPSTAATLSSSGSRPAHLRHPPGLAVPNTPVVQESLDDAPPLAEEKWGSVKTASSTNGLVTEARRLGSREESGGYDKSVTSRPSLEGTNMAEAMASMTSDQDVSGGASTSRPRSDTFNSGTTEAIVTDNETGAVMHFPTKVWDPQDGEGQWPDDAWTEFPAPGQAKWWGPPKSLKRYQAQTGDPGILRGLSGDDYSKKR